MRKKSVIILSFLCLSCALTVAVLAAACNDNEKTSVLRAEYTVDYGDSFVLPVTDCELTVKDSKGNVVEIYDGRFPAYDLNGYTIEAEGQDAPSKVIVVDREAPEIDLSFEYKRIEGTESEVRFPLISAKDNVDGTTETEITLKNQKGEDVAFTDNTFVPKEFGMYNLNIKSADSSGNVAEKEVFFDVIEKTLGIKAVVGAYDSVYGPKQVKSVKGFTPKYSEEVSLPGERGSTKLEFNGDEVFAPTFRLTKLVENDVSDYNGIMMSIYNDSNQTANMTINWVFSYSLQPKQWTEIYIPASSYDRFGSGGNEITKDKVSAESLENMYFEIYSASAGGFDGMDLYLSEFYAIKSMEPEDFDAVIEKMSYPETEEELAEYELMIRCYEQFSTEEKLQIKKYNDLQKNYWEYMLNTYGDGTADKDKVYYLNNDLGKQQYAISGGNAGLSEEIYCPDDPCGDTVVTKVIALGGYMHFTFNKPIVSDMSSVDVDANGKKILKSLYFYVYSPVPAAGYSYYCDIWNDAKWVDVPLSAGWTYVEFPLNNGSVSNLEVELGMKLNGTAVSLPADTVFYVTSVYGIKSGTKQIDSDIEDLLSKSLSDEEFLQEAEKIVVSYSKLTLEEKKASTEWIEKFKSAYAEAVSGKFGAPADDRAFYLDEDYDLYGLTGKSGTELHYSSDVAYNGAHGSLAINRAAGVAEAWSIGLYFNIPIANADAKSFYCYVMYETAEDDTLTFVAPNQEGANESTKLTKGTWTKVTMNAAWVKNGGDVYITCNNWADQIPEDCTIYFSAIFAA